MHYQDALEQELEELGMELRKLPSVAPAVMDQVVADAAAPKAIAWNVPVEASSFQMRIPDGYSEQAVDEFTKRLRPGRAPTGRPLTPTEAFRKWSDDNK